MTAPTTTRGRPALGALLVDQTGCRPVTVGAVDALPGGRAACAAVVPSPERVGVDLVATVGEPVDGLGPVVTVVTILRTPRQPGGVARRYAVQGPCVIVAHDGAGPVPLTCGEMLAVLGALYRDDDGERESRAVSWLLDWTQGP